MKADPKKRLMALFTRSIVSELVQRSLGLLNSILLIRYLGAETVGNYLLLIALFSIGPALFNSLDHAITRFLGGIQQEERSSLSIAVLVSKLYGTLVLVMVVGILVVFGVEFQAVQNLASSEQVLLLLGIAFNFFLIPLLASWSNRIFAVYECYKFLIITELLQAFFTTAWISIAVLVMVPNLSLVVGGSAAVLAISTGFKLLKLRSIEPGLSEGFLTSLWSPRSCFRVLYQRPRLRYFAPFLLTSSSGYLKDLFPVLIVGSVASANLVAEYRVIQQIFRVAHSIVPNAFEVIRPVLLKRVVADKVEFAARYQKYSQIYLIGISICCLAVLVTLPLTVGLWGLSLSKVLFFTTMVFALELLFGAATHVEYQVFLLSESTTYLAFMTVTRQIATAIVTVFAGYAWGPPGVALGATVGALYAWLGFATYSYRTQTRSGAHLSRTFLLVTFLSLLICSTLVALYWL